MLFVWLRGNATFPGALQQMCVLQQGGDRGCRLLLARHAPASTGVRRRTVGSFLRWKSSSRKAKKDEEHCKADTEGNDSSPVYFPLEGNANKPDYRAAGAVLPLSIDAESHRSSGAGRFYLHRSEEGGVVTLPSVTTILDATMPRSSYFALRQWQQSMQKQVGEDEFSNFKRDVTGKGLRFHDLVERHLLAKHRAALSEDVTEVEGAPEVSEKLVAGSSDQLEQDKSSVLQVEKEDEVDGLLEEAGAEQLQVVPARYSESVREVLSEIGEVVAVESVVRHLELGYMGRVDCIGRYKGVWCAIDWKTSRRPRPKLRDMYDGPLQVCAYMGAVNQDQRYPVKVTHALLVAAYESGSPCDVHFLSEEQCREQWERWLERQHQFKTCFAHDLSNVY